LTTTEVTSITTTTSASGGNISSDGGSPVTDRGICWGNSTSPTITGSKTSDGTGTGSFISNLTGLADGTVFYVRAYATNSAGTAYGNEITFTTIKVVIPTVATATPVNVSSNYAQGGGNITSDGGAAIITKGVCWSTSINPTISDSKTEEGTGTGSFSTSMAGLEPATNYHVRAYATNSAGVAYGEDIEFTTPAGMPVLTTLEVSDLTGTGAISGGNITNDGGAAIITRGVCWNTTGAPTPDGPKTTDGNGAGPFTSTITGLTINTKYYVRAYATNSIGLSFGEELTFTTLSITTATLTTSAVTNILKTTAVGGGNITNDGGSAITARGVCWSLNQGPTLSDPHSSDDSGSGIFNSQLTGLSPGRTYYVRAYASNASGNIYGNQVSFITASDLPAVTTSAPSLVTATTANPGGEVVEENGATVSTRGICYNTVGSPVTTDSKKDETAGMGTFTMSLTALTPSTTYYARAFAVNSVGTAYGSQIQFTTTAAAATITTTAISGIASTSAFIGCNLTSDGGSAVLTRGVCWSTSANPTAELSSKTNDGSGTGIFTSRITPLLPTTTYYARAYATNSSGTTFYSDEISFTTTIQVTDVESHTYNTVRIGTQLWMQDNLYVTKYRDGTAINYVTDNAQWGSQTTGAYSWYGNNSADGDTYGALYNHFTTINNLNLCPTGWHVPTDAEWSAMENYLMINGFNYDGTTSGNKLAKSMARTTNWSSSTVTGAVGNSDYPSKRNQAGFAALPGGYRSSDGTYYTLLLDGNWWSTTLASATAAYRRNIDYNTSSEIRSTFDQTYGISVRCIQGEGQVLPAVTTTAISGISATVAISGGNVTSDGNASVTAKGVCWSTSANPVISSGNYTNDGSGTGTYSSTISVLSPGTTYYVRAYATNSVGTVYGNEIPLTTTSTVPGAPTIGTATAGNAQAVVTFTAPASNGGSAITGYTVTSNPDDHTGSGLSSPITVTGLTNGTTYTFTVTATNINGTGTASAASNSVIPSISTTVYDVEGNLYNIVTIGTQTWMVENLKTTKYNDNTEITLISDKDTWAGLISEAYCWYSNDEASYKNPYGVLYNWYAVNTGKLCPLGWHVPELADWQTLQTFVGGNDIGGAKLKEAGLVHWKTPNVGADNETGFTGLPGGYRDHYGNFYDILYKARFWSSTEESSYTAHYATLNYNDAKFQILHSYPDERHGNSVRCIKD
jgi:uncharacterized protein (TIGR02145 family)